MVKYAKKSADFALWHCILAIGHQDIEFSTLGYRHNR